jgi:hypothetical protein
MIAQANIAIDEKGKLTEDKIIVRSKEISQ